MTQLQEVINNFTQTSDEELENKKFTSIDSDYSNIEDQENVFQTEPGISIKSSSRIDRLELGSKISTVDRQEDIIISEAEGVIDRVEEKTVRVKLFPKTYVNFPRILFKDEKRSKQGQHIKYMIKRDVEGYRYQEITPINDVKQHPEKEKVLTLVDEFKFRNE